MIRQRLLDIHPAALLIAPPLLVVYTLAQALAARAMGAAVTRISLGVGPMLWQQGTVQLRLLPISAHLQLATEEDEDTDGLRYDQLSVRQKLALQLTGPATLAVLIPLFLSLHEDLGLMCGILLGMNLLPTPTTAGGQSVAAVLEAARGKSLSDGVLAAWTLGGLVIVVALLVWLFVLPT